MNKANPNQMIATAIHRERTRAGKSLSALAVEAGLAKSTLSQLENGAGNPSVETLWAIASALGIPFSFLFETQTRPTKLIRAHEGETIGSEQSDFVATLLSACAPSARRDIYRVLLQPGETRSSSAHPNGTVEHMLICAGSAKVGPSGQEEELSQGDYFSFPGDLPHSYTALEPGTVMIMVMETT